jgi:Uma2 family endonuclease
MQKIVQREIVLPETQPETEWLRGRAVQKVSPKRKHGEVQLWLGARLRDWARGRGRVASEWRFRIAPPGEVIRPLVPDISYLAYDRMLGASAEDWETPLVPPTVAIEIRSPDDRRADLEDKIATLLRAGTELVIVIESRTRTMTCYDSGGRHELSEQETLTHPVLPGFSLPLAEMFAEIEFDPPKRRLQPPK